MDFTWDELTAAMLSCRRCNLCAGRTHVVPGEGDREADVMFVGEGPGYREDVEGRPFVGPAGQLLDRMLAAIGLTRASVYIANVVKCRPPNNRDPAPDERAACLPYLRAQFLLVRPRIIVCLGRISAHALIGEDVRISRDHGTITRKKNVLFMPTYHPAALLRDASHKREAWEDWQRLRDALAKGADGGGEAT